MVGPPFRVRSFTLGHWFTAPFHTLKQRYQTVGLNYRVAANFLLQLIVLTLGFTSSFLVNIFFKHTVSFETFKSQAYRNAKLILQIERDGFIYWEPTLQTWAMRATPIAGWQFWNTYYAGVHTLVTVGVMVVLLLLKFYQEILPRRKRSQVTPGYHSRHSANFKVRQEPLPHHNHLRIHGIRVSACDAAKIASALQR